MSSPTVVVAQPFPPNVVPFVDPKSGALTDAGSRFLRSIWTRTGSASGTVPLPSDAATISYVDTHVASAVAPLAPSASPVFSGTPEAPTPAAADSSTKLATTAFVAAQSYATIAYTTGAIGAAVSGLAPSASPVLTGAPEAPTAAAGTDTTQIATTAFVGAAVAATPAAHLQRATVSLGTIAAGATGSGSVTFSPAFSTAPAVALVTTSSPDLSMGVDPTSITETGFAYTYTSRAASGSASYSFSWLAV